MVAETSEAAFDRSSFGEPCGGPSQRQVGAA